MTETIDLDKLVRDVRQTLSYCAKVTSRKWVGLLSQEEIESVVLEWLISNPSAQRALLERSPAEVKKLLFFRCRLACSQERIDFDQFSGNWWYSVDEVKILSQAWPRNGITSIEEKVDLEQAFHRLRPASQDALWELVIDGTPQDANQRRRANRALNNLANMMNASRNSRVAAHLDKGGRTGSHPIS